MTDEVLAKVGHIMGGLHPQTSALEVFTLFKIIILSLIAAEPSLNPHVL